MKRPTLRPLFQRTDVWSCSSGAAAPAQQPQDWSVRLAGVWSGASCTGEYSFPTTKRNRFNSYALTTHCNRITIIALFSSCCFHHLLFYRMRLNATCSMIDVYGNKKVASSEETTYGWGGGVASTKGSCKFLTCLTYVNEPFSRSDIITARGYCLWWKDLSRVPLLPCGGGGRKSKV